MSIKKVSITIVMVAIVGLAVFNFDLDIHIKSANAESGEGDWSPTQPAPDLDVYYPGTEALQPDEMRIVALGTGMPSPRPKQAAACWLVELGNGDKFLFDLGAGCHERIAEKKIPYDFIDKVFIQWSDTGIWHSIRNEQDAGDVRMGCRNTSRLH